MHPPDPFAHRYTKLRLLGRGGFGAVYRASDTEMEREVALKLLNPDLAADADWRRRFRQEATAASKLNHPNITIVFDRGEFQDQPFIVMELVEGETLSKVIENRVPLSDPERIGLLEQLCDGLHYAHQRDIVHRDIKPVNLVVREDDDGTHRVRTLKILDFGIAKVVSSGQTATGGMMFTPSYVSPEQVLGEDVDRRGDIFAVGAVAYELLVGEKAFVISSNNPFTILDEVKRKIVQEPHRPMQELRRDLDGELSAIVDRALAKSPADRFRDLAEMRRRLRKVRERLEEASPAVAADITIVIAPKLQMAVRLARQALEAGDATAAVGHLEKAVAGAASERERQFLQAPLQEARDRQAAIQVDRKAHDQAAAQAAIRMATSAFAEGDRTAAIRTLGDFEPPDLVAERLARLQQADRAIADAEKDVREGNPGARAQALTRLASFEDADLVATPLAELRVVDAQRRADEARDAAARTAVATARQRFDKGDRQGALDSLTAFTPAHPVVDAALAKLTQTAAALEAAETKQREAQEARWKDEQRLQDQAGERAETLERARVLRVQAREAFVLGDTDRAIELLARFRPADLVAETRDELRTAAAAIAAAAAEVADDNATAPQRRAAIEQLSTLEPRDLYERALTELRAIDARARPPK